MELLEASRYDLLEGIPVLLTSVSVDVASAVSMSDWLIARANPYLYVQLMNVHMVINGCRLSVYVITYSVDLLVQIWLSCCLWHHVHVTADSDRFPTLNSLCAMAKSYSVLLVQACPTMMKHLPSVVS